MKDLIILVDICKTDLDGLGIKYGKVCNWTVNTRAKCRWGLCKKVGFGLFDISIAEALLADDIDEQKANNTIVHKLFTYSS